MITLTFIDELNVALTGLTKKQISYVREKTKIFDQSARSSVAYEMGHDDGYRYLFDEEGFFFQYMIPKVFDLLETLKVNIDNIQIEDERLPDGVNDIPLIDDQFLIEETGFTLRDHQVSAVNAALTERRGIIANGTSSGKTAEILGISKALDGILKTIVVVPSDLLSRQTYEYYEKSNLNAVRLHSKISVNTREQVFNDHDHIIITNKLLLNCMEFIKDGQYALLIDEIHSYFGENFSDALRLDLGNCPIRLGLTGTIPRDKYKAMRIFCHLGGHAIDTVKAKTLIANKQASSLNIEMIQTIHPEMADVSSSHTWSWDVEKKYITSNQIRFQVIADYIKSLPPTNTLVLCHAAAGKELCKHFDGRIIVDETPIDVREEMASEFDSRDDAMIFGTWGTISTGLSRSRIFRVILVDPTKDASVQQSIGRGIRLDGEKDHVEVIDISADTKYAMRHRKERMKIYREEGFPYKESDTTITIEDDE